VVEKNFFSFTELPNGNCVIGEKIMNTNDLLHRWSTQSLAEIEDQIISGDDRESIVQLLGADTVAEIQAISFGPPQTGPREDVVLLPGIMGSLLSSIRGVTSLLWINPLLFLQGNARYLRLNATGDSDESLEVECVPIGLEKLTYLKISLLLNRQVNLREFPYDWRRPIENNADILHTCLERWSGDDPQRKFTLVAHSMGGLVSRTYMARHPDSAEKHIKRLIMHGTPNFGSTNAIDTLLNGNSMMATVDRLNKKNDMRELVYGLPSIYQLLPVPTDLFPSGYDYPANFDLYQAAEWKFDLIQQKYLDGALALHQVLAESDPQVEQVVIAGCNIETIVGVRLVNSSATPKLEIAKVKSGQDSGDGTVPLWSALLPAARCFFVQEVHRNLPGNGRIIRATLDLIQSGHCDLPTELPPPKLLPFDAPDAGAVPVELQAEDLKNKIENGTAGDDDLNNLYFAF
jgi:pimeloyl-ACP methyl ester carboxylesterase